MVEIGNRDIVGHTSLSIAPMVQDRPLISVDMAEILEYKPHECKGELVNVLIEPFNSTPLTRTDFSRNLLTWWHEVLLNQSALFAPSTPPRSNRHSDASKLVNTWAK
jgi:hypothetical protein